MMDKVQIEVGQVWISKQAPHGPNGKPDESKREKCEIIGLCYAGDGSGPPFFRCKVSGRPQEMLKDWNQLWQGYIPPRHVLNLPDDSTPEPA